MMMMMMMRVFRIEMVSRVGECKGKRGIQRRKHLCLLASRRIFRVESRAIIKSSTFEINHRTSGCPFASARVTSPCLVYCPELVLWSDQGDCEAR